MKLEDNEKFMFVGFYLKLEDNEKFRFVGFWRTMKRSGL